MSAWFLRKYLSDGDLAAITAAIGEAEKNTIGEIRVSIRHRRHWRERKLPLHDLTIAEFHRLGMQNTRQRTGVLILLMFAERKFHIVGDTGIHMKIGNDAWQRIAGSMTEHFRDGRFRDGIIAGVTDVGAELAAHFPKTEGDTNELSNDVSIR